MCLKFHKTFIKLCNSCIIYVRTRWPYISPVCLFETCVGLVANRSLVIQEALDPPGPREIDIYSSPTRINSTSCLTARFTAMQYLSVRLLYVAPSTGTYQELVIYRSILNSTERRWRKTIEPSIVENAEFVVAIGVKDITNTDLARLHSISLSALPCNQPGSIPLFFSALCTENVCVCVKNPENNPLFMD